MSISANDAEFTDLYTAATNVDVEDVTPNAVLNGPSAPAFDLHLHGIAGSNLGGSQANYDLTLTCIDDTAAAPVPSMSPGLIQQEFKDPVWKKVANNGFVSDQVFAIQVPNGARGHVFHYQATLVDAATNVVSFLRSKPFILV